MMLDIYPHKSDQNAMDFSETTQFHLHSIFYWLLVTHKVIKIDSNNVSNIISIYCAGVQRALKMLMVWKSSKVS